MKLDLPKGDLVEKRLEDGLFYGKQEFMAFLKLLRDCCLAPRLAFGPTADRPVRYIEVGYGWYDTTLNKPVWVSSINPIVWRDSAGVIS